MAEVLESRAASLAGVAEGVAYQCPGKVMRRAQGRAPIFKACDQILKGKITTKEALLRA